MTEYILETTSLNRDEQSENILLLGNWCSYHLIDNNQVIVPYHWDDREKLLSDYKEIFRLYDLYLSNICNLLNRYHKVNYTEDYWRIVVGPWLYYFICIVFDRYEMLSLTSETYKVRETSVANYNIEDWIPCDYVEFKNFFVSQKWNYYLYSEILRKLKIFPLKETGFDLKKNNEKYSRHETWLKKTSKTLMFCITRFIPSSLKRVVFVEVDIRPKSLFYILLKLKQFPISYYKRKQPEIDVIDLNNRKLNFQFDVDLSVISNLLNHLIPLNIPSSYLEGYKKIVVESKKIYPKNIDIAVTSNAYFSNEHFKVWIAEKKERGAKLLVAVHGGHHGPALYNGPGKLTEDIASVFYGWGWGKHTLPSPKLSRLKAIRIDNSNKSDILFIPYTLSQYSNHIDSSPISSTFEKCLEMQERLFVKFRQIDLLNNVVVRIKGNDFGWGLENRYRTHGVKRFADTKKESLVDNLSTSGIVIVTYDSTVMLESFTLNVPTLLFFKKELWEMNPRAEKYFLELKSAGVLHYDENSLFTHVNEVFNNITLWWDSDAVQSAVNNFLSVYGVSNNNWKELWYKEIKDQLAL